jgi:hypothetical protein
MPRQLLTRDTFRESVFKRDSYKCVVCKQPAVDAHHIIDRKLFVDGGYYIDNGTSLCSECHILAEDTTFSCEYLRKLSGITELVVPDNFYDVVTYNKWGHALHNVDGEIKIDMNNSKKYPRTYHLPYSPGTTSDDRIAHDYWHDLCCIPSVVITEKLDGENNCLNKYGVFARSHSTPTVSPWTSKMRERWNLIKNDLGDLEIFGENMYAIHSIEYLQLQSDYYVFAVRDGDVWLPWEEVKFYAACFDIPTVPEIEIIPDMGVMSQSLFETIIQSKVHQQSILVSSDPAGEFTIPMEGVVVRNVGSFTTEEFPNNVWKWVRKDHVKTDEHWTKNWKKANFNYNYGYEK